MNTVFEFAFIFVFINKFAPENIIFPTLKIEFVVEYSVDPDEMPLV